VNPEAVPAKVPPAPDLPGRIPELDGLRGLAILLVVICHYAGAEHSSLGYWTNRVLRALSIGWSGVDLFFVLSGFLIGGILIDARDSRRYFRAFYMRRVFRILPIYYLWVVLYAAIVAGGLWLVPGRTPFTPKDFFRLPIQFLFLQNMMYEVTHFQLIWLGATWSLAVEEQFYLVAPPIIRWLSIRKLTVALAAVVITAPLIRLSVFWHLADGSYAAAQLMPCRADALALGILSAVAWRSEQFQRFLRENPALPKRLLVALLIGFLALLWWLVHPLNAVTITIGYGWIACTFACLLLATISDRESLLARFFRARPLAALGTISYCVYLIHGPIQGLMFELLLHSKPQIQTWRGIAVTLFAAIITYAVASFSWLVLEKPLIRRGHTYLYGEDAT